MKILFLSCHEILEYDLMRLFTELDGNLNEKLDIEIFSLNGAFQNPLQVGSGVRSIIPKGKLYEGLYQVALQCDKDHIHPELLEWADVVLMTHNSAIPGQKEQQRWLVKNAPLIDKMKKKIVWYSIGQSTPEIEKELVQYRKLGLKIVRYSPIEALIPNYAGHDAIIRFPKDPEEFKGWTGEKPVIITIAQSFRKRGEHLGYALFEKITDRFQRKVYGTENIDLGDLWGGPRNYSELKQNLRESRCFFYFGTIPAPYTLSLIEAMMCFPPETIVSSNTKIEDVLEKDFIGELIVIKTVNGEIKCTPNHPFLTTSGWKKAENLTITDCIYTIRNTHDENKQLDKRRIGDFVKKFPQINKKGFGQFDSKTDPSCNLCKKERVGSKRKQQEYFPTNEPFFNQLRNMLLGGNIGWRRNSYFQSKFQDKKDISNDIFVNDNTNIDKLVKGKIQRGKKSTLQYQEQTFRETKNGLYVLLKRLATSSSFRGIKALSLNQKRALWNSDFFYQKSSESKIYGEILKIRNKLLEKDKTIKQTRIIRIKKIPYKGKVYNLSTADGIYWANGFLVHNTGIPVVAVGSKLRQMNVFNWKNYEIPDLIANGINGYISDNIDELRNYIQLLMDNPDVAKRIGEAGRRLAIQLWDMRERQKEWAQFLKSI